MLQFIRCLSVLVLLSFLALEVQAQHTQRIGFRMGSAAPIGDFKKDRFEDEYPPMAKQGINLEGHYRVDIKPYLAVGATAGWRTNRFDMDAFASADDVLVQRREASGWKSTYALADLYLQSAPGSLFGFVKASVGAAYNKSPQVQVDTAYGPIRRNADTAMAFAYGIGSGFGIVVGRVLFTLDIGVLNTRPNFEISDAQGNRSTVKQPMHTVNSMLGLSYTL